tara:strand:+ start:87 stop:551 length:465 start_codon:yes stop_codon:yes gene_type:complete
MSKLTVNEAALQGFSDVITFEAGEVFKNDTATAGTVKTYAVPAGTALTRVSAHKIENFTGGSLSAVKLDIGYGGDGAGTIDDFIDNFNLFSGDEFALSTGEEFDGSDGHFHLFTSDDTIDIEFTPTGDGMDAATAGKVVIKFDLIDLRDPAEIN